MTLLKNHLIKTTMLCAVSLLALTGLSSAQVMVMESSSASTPYGQYPGSFSFTLPTFDTHMGTLVGIDLTLASYIVPSVIVTNSSSSMTESFTDATSQMTYTLTAPDTTLSTSSFFSQASGMAAPGVNTFSGSTAFTSETADAILPLSAYEGTGTQTVSLDLTATDVVTGSGPSDLSFSGDGFGNSIITVDYYFLDPVPEPSSLSLLGMAAALLVLGRVVLRKRSTNEV